jgi:hypothetical protein
MTTTTTIDILRVRAETLASARALLADMVTELQSGIEALKADHMDGIREAIDGAAAAWKALEAEIEANPLLFVKPRTISAHGIKFGLAKGRGGLVIEDEERTLALIRKHLPDQADVLIATKEAPVKDALVQLPAADLKRIGVQVKDTGDQVLIKPADGEVDKLVKALVAAAVNGEDE